MWGKWKVYPMRKLASSELDSLTTRYIFKTPRPPKKTSTASTLFISEHVYLLVNARDVDLDFLLNN